MQEGERNLQPEEWETDRASMTAAILTVVFQEREAGRQFQQSIFFFTLKLKLWAKHMKYECTWCLCVCDCAGCAQEKPRLYNTLVSLGTCPN